jgi:hypothetical protein
MGIKPHEVQWIEKVALRKIKEAIMPHFHPDYVPPKHYKSKLRP